MPVDPLLRGLIAGFVVETQDIAESVTRALLALERPKLSGETMAKEFEQVARGLHTLKGSAGSLGLEDVAAVAHRMEDQVAPLIAAGRPVAAAVADHLLKSLDALVNRVRAHAAGTDDSLPSIEAALEAASLPPGAVALAPEPAQASGRDEVPALDLLEGGEESAASWRVSTGQVVALMHEAERLREVRLRLEERRRELDRAVEQLSRLGMLSATAEARMRLLGVSRAIASDGEEIADIVSSLEEEVKVISTLPLRTVLESLHRAVRDLCRAEGKEARLSLVGAELSLDRRILVALRPALVHLVRNAVDHGIEAPAERERRGKHREGAIVVRFEQQGSVVFLEVADDGAGVDAETVRDAARRQQVVPDAELDAMEESRLRQLIFRPGFSTRPDVTATSGRGVGLDVVRAQVQALRGTIEVQSTPGQGTRFVLSLPTELGSSPILVVRCDEQQVGLPLLSVESIVPTSSERVHTSGSQMSLEHQGRLYRLDDLGARLGLRQPQMPARKQPLLLLQVQGEWSALSVDEVVGERELVIRPLPAELRDLAAYQGAAMLARGELLPVLRSDWLVKGASRAESPVSTRRALVVDDSLTARALHRTMLESGGFTVHAVGSGRQAMEQLHRSAYDVIVADIGMEDMDGLELTRAVRQQSAHAHTPILLVSARGDGRSEALAAGADGFLSKADCASGRLLSELSAALARRRGNA